MESHETKNILANGSDQKEVSESDELEHCGLNYSLLYSLAFRALQTLLLSLLLGPNKYPIISEQYQNLLNK